VTYDDMFLRATGCSPFPYQRSLALANAWPEALSAPTGAGKTAAVGLGWLFRRRFASADVRRATPRRLVLCLPMRALVTQTSEAVTSWLRALDQLDEGIELARGDRVSVHLLMGGQVADAWHLHPERDAVLIGTQDMLLSRALNRGYGQSRFLWPWLYALVTNDCLWVFDEVQIMGVGLATGLQLSAFRKALGTFGPAYATFMSATLDRTWLATVDHPAPDALLTLSDADLATPDLARRRRAPKRLERARTVIDRDCEGALADEILARHRQGTRTIVVLNTVDRAVAVADAIHQRSKKPAAPPVLLHSRFRPADRDAALARALAAGFDGVVVSTQVIEAGVDVSAPLLVTELAPWASLVQRAGRCNRGGEYEDAVVVWCDHANEKIAMPYGAEELAAARTHLQRLKVFNPEAIERAGVSLDAPSFAHVLRRRDVIDLFDTTPDLGGADLDVSRFIRDGDERDVQVFWRDFARDPEASEPRPARGELCSVPFLDLRRWMEAEHGAWRWDVLDGEWVPARRDAIVPGGVFMLRAADGGYTAERGWNQRSKAAVTVVLPMTSRNGDVVEEAIDADPLSELGAWVPLTTHALDTRAAAVEILGALGMDDLPVESAVLAAQAHDLGKAHDVFQRTMRQAYPGQDTATLWAKSGGGGRHERRGFRHELASALAWLVYGDGDDRDLIAYLLASHHGKVRLSIRALPTDTPAPRIDQLHARGVWDGDALPGADLGSGLVVPPTVLSLSPMRLGRQAGHPSWVERVLALRDRWGPFRLAYLEAIVRAADVRATLREREKDKAR
jgi:CRISPR-associated endonuclease/helicase Cas3